MATSPYLRIGRDGTDLGYNKAVTDAAVAVAQSGDRRTYVAAYPATWSYPDASGTNTLRVTLPRTYLNVDTLPVRMGVVRQVTTDATLQSAISASQPGDWIVIAAGTYTGTYNFPMRSGDSAPGGNNVTVLIGKPLYDALQNGVLTYLPQKVRVQASDVTTMPYFKNVTPGNVEQIAFDGATKGWRFIGLRFGVDPSIPLLSRIARLGNGDGSIQPNASLCPQNVGFDRCAFDGHPTLELKAAVEMHAKSQYVIDSYFGDEIHNSGADCQALRFYNSPGPSCVLNNRLVASTENVIVGGAFSACGLPSDLEFRWNFLEKPLTWNANHPSYAGVQWDIKNLFELKACGYALIEGNYMRRSWPANQTGYGLLLKAESYGNGATIGYTHDVLSRWNVIENVSIGLNIAGVPNVDPANPPQNVWSYGELYKVGGQYFDASGGDLIQTGLLTNSGAIHSTFISLTTVNAIGQPSSCTGLGLIDCIFDQTVNSFKASGLQDGNATIAGVCTTPDIANDVWISCVASRYAGHGFTPDVPTGQASFTNYAGGDYSQLGTTQTAGGPQAVLTGITITTQPSNINSGGTVSLVAQLVDQFGAPYAATASITASVASGSATILSGGTAATTGSGSATFAIGMSAASTNSVTLTLSSPGLASVTTQPFTITVGTPAVATSLSITTQPTSVASGVVMSPAVVVKVLDQFGAVFNSNATITAVLGTGSATVSGGSTAVASGGTATFSGLTLTTTTTSSNTLTFCAAGLTGVVSQPFNVTANVTPVATSLFLSQQPGNGTSGSPLSTQPVVKVLDQFGNVWPHGATGYPITVTVLSGTATITAGSPKSTTVGTGIATFTNLTLTDSVPSTNTLRFSSPGLTSVDSQSFTITPVRVATALAMVRQPAGSTSDVALTTQPQVAVVDQFGAIIASSAPITATVGTGSASVTAGGSAVASAGTATFAGLTLHATATNAVTLSFSSPGLTGVSSTAFTVTVPAVPVATSLSITTQPAGSTSGIALTQQPVLQVLDQFGAPITSSVAVTATVASGTASITNATATASGGIATFSGLTLTTGATNAITLTFSAGGLTSVTSNAVTVTVPPTVRVATALAIETQPSGAASGVALLTQPRVLVVDQFGAQIASTATVTASIYSGSATIAAGGSVAAVGGAAQFATLTLTTSVTGQVGLTFSAPGLTSVNSALFTATAPVLPPTPDPIPTPTPDPTPTPPPLVATSLRIRTAPTVAVSGTLLSPQPVVEVLDQNGNVLLSSALTITVTCSGATVTSGATANAVNGVATFSGTVVT